MNTEQLKKFYDGLEDEELETEVEVQDGQSSPHGTAVDSLSCATAEVTVAAPKSPDRPTDGSDRPPISELIDAPPLAPSAEALPRSVIAMPAAPAATPGDGDLAAAAPKVAGSGVRPAPRRATFDGVVVGGSSSVHQSPVMTTESRKRPAPLSAPAVPPSRRVTWAPDVFTPRETREELHKRARLLSQAELAATAAGADGASARGEGASASGGGGGDAGGAQHRQDHEDGPSESEPAHGGRRAAKMPVRYR